MAGMADGIGSRTTATPTDPLDELRAKLTPLMRVQRVLHSHQALGPTTVLLLSCVVFSIINPRFLYAENLSLIVQQVAVIGSLAIGQTVIMLTAGIDLSDGAAMILAQMVIAETAANWGVPAPLALLLGFLVGGVAGLVNGFLVTRINLPPFIVTLGTLSVYTALGLLYSAGQAVSGPSISGLITWTGVLVNLGPFNVTTGVLVMVGLCGVTSYALRHTTWGRHIYAVGDDADSARLVGIRTTRVLLSAYFVAGIIYALAAWILIGRVGIASPTNAVNANLDSITAAVIGGTSLFGGRGSVVGTLVGALIVGVYQSGIALANVQSLYQNLVEGILIIAAVALDQWIRQVRR